MVDSIRHTTTGHTFSLPTWRCLKHGEVGVVIMIDDAEPHHFCLRCWGEWMEAQGWRVERIER